MKDMKNNECIITISNNKNEVLQWFDKKDKQWRLHTQQGTAHKCTIEQFVSHLLSALRNTKLIVEVIERKE